MPTQTLWTNQLDTAIDGLFERMVAVRRHLHANPEGSGGEQETTRYLAGLMDDAGLSPRLGPDERGLWVDWPERDDGAGRPSASPRRIGLRADIDAVRIQDAKSVDYRSRVPGLMHACGHDAHAAILFGAVLGLLELERRGETPWPVRCRAIFQPAEESNRGALEMIEAGAIDGLDALLALHMDPTRPVGAIGVAPGTITADCDEMEIHIYGRGGHAARPHESLDPIAAAAQLVSSMYLFVPRGADSQEPVVVTIGHIAGGEAYNVIPDHVMLRGTLRCLGKAAERTVQHIRQLARGIAEASGTRIEIGFKAGPPSVVNDRALTRLVREVAIDLLGEERVQRIGRPSMGGEDFANYLPHVPGCLYRLGCAPTADELGPLLHTPEFDIDERAMAVGAKIFARAVVQWSMPQG